MKCPDCQTPFNEGDKYCSKCRADLDSIYLFKPVCPQCRKEYPDGIRFCADDSTALVSPEKMIPKCIICNKEYPEGTTFCSADGGTIIAEAFRTPEPQSFSMGTSLPDKELSTLANESYTVNVGNWIRQGWKYFTQYTGGFLGFTALYIFAMILPQLVPGIGTVIVLTLLAQPLSVGFLNVSFKIDQGKTPNFGDFFKGFNHFLPLVLFGIVGGLLMTVGYFLLIIPGIYFTVSYTFANVLIIDRRIQFFQAMEFSRKKVGKKWFGIFWLLIMLFAINFLGVLALGVGVLFTIPISACTLAAAYKDIFGLKSEDY